MTRSNAAEELNQEYTRNKAEQFNDETAGDLSEQSESFKREKEEDRERTCSGGDIERIQRETG
jgi:hypothetical protein